MLLINICPTYDLPVRTEAGRKSTTRCTLDLPWVFASCCVCEIKVKDFLLHNDISIVFTIHSLAATCFGRMTIFKWKYIERKLTRLPTDPLFFGGTR
jgi:hypothetical protein